jgi:hypothetical protein
MVVHHPLHHITMTGKRLAEALEFYLTLLRRFPNLV